MPRFKYSFYRRMPAAWHSTWICPSSPCGPISSRKLVPKSKSHDIPALREFVETPSCRSSTACSVAVDAASVLDRTHELFPGIPGPTSFAGRIQWVSSPQFPWDGRRYEAKKAPVEDDWGMGSDHDLRSLEWPQRVAKRSVDVLKNRAYGGPSWKFAQRERGLIAESPIWRPQLSPKNAA